VNEEWKEASPVTEGSKERGGKIMSTLIRWRPTLDWMPLKTFDPLWDWDLEGFGEDFLESGSPKEVPWVPRVESYEKDGNYVIKTDLPGVEAKDLQVMVENGCLTIQGERKMDKEIKEKEIRRRELFYGSFQRTMAVPEGVKAENIKAKYHDGVLEITAPMEKKALPKKVAVEIEKT
jgi:HSP20 family protein